MIDPTAAGSAPSQPGPIDPLADIIVGKKEGVAWLNGAHLNVIMNEPLPGIVIFVHGVNSDGEWYTAAEKGLCAGLNERLKRCDDHMAYPTAEGGQLTPATYMPELTPDGFISPKMTHKTFITGDEHFTPVIHFRWGYKANSDELQTFGDGIYLNEENYWGGGPFANGCSSLPDLWCEGLSENLLLWFHIEHVNPTPDRFVFSCPPRPYYVLAALRLAKLIESIRKLQADVPITIVCHSQGNMVSMAAAFLGDAMTPVKDTVGIEGRCVADTYVLCNPPYSLVKANRTEDFGDSAKKDKYGGTGRQSAAARIGTLRAFLDIIRKPTARRQESADIDRFMANENHGFTIAGDRLKYGCGASQSTCGRVTLYCNPHDQVISSTPVQGIGWSGLSQAEIDAVGGQGIFTQRVFAQGFEVGTKGTYDYWSNHYKQPVRGSTGFWVPESPTARYSVSKGLDAHKGRVVGKILTVASAPLLIFALSVFKQSVNALPDKDWKIPLDAPDLPEPFKPEAVRFGARTDKFDQGYDAAGQSRDKDRVRDAGDPYAGDRPLPQQKGEDAREATDAPLGDADSEAGMRYEDHARLRMQARREGFAKKTDEHVEGEDHPEQASPDYTKWREKKIKTFLADTVDTHATDHSTIMTNDMHAQKALAYDVAIGLCHIGDNDLHKLRIAADWRFLEGLDKSDSSRLFQEYFMYGKFEGVSAFDWAHAENSAGHMPDKIVDLREHQPRRHQAPKPGNRGGARMTSLISTRARRFSWATLAFLLAFGTAIIWPLSSADTALDPTNGEMIMHFLVTPTLAAIAALTLLTAFARPAAQAIPATPAAAPTATPQPFLAQVVGVQWLNPLQRRDYPTEWQLLWTLGLAKPNKDDDMVRTDPESFAKLQMVGSIASGGNGRETFQGYHEKYVTKMISKFYDIYFSSSSYFYNAHSLTDKATRRELAGIHVEYALPEGRLDPIEAAAFTRQTIIDCFNIGNVHFPNAWTRNTPPDIRVTTGGPNAGFSSLKAALDYLQAHPNETVWAMNWDAPSFPPKDDQINENMVLLVLAGPDYKTGRDALAWIGLPASSSPAEFESQPNLSAVVQAWTKTVTDASANAGKTMHDIGYAIHDANNTRTDSADRMRYMAHVLTLNVPGFDFVQHTFNTPALLGEMGAGTALTNVALGIAYANHFGKNVLVAGTSDTTRSTAVMVVPPAQVRPLDADKPWFRARSGNNAYLMWWGIRHDAEFRMQGYSK